MTHHSIDYKIHAIKYYKKHKSFRKTCSIFGCSKSSLQRWLNKYRNTKSLKRKKRIEKVVIPEEEKLFVKDFVKDHPNITVQIITKEVNKMFNKKYHYLKIYYLLKELKISYKKLRLKYFPKKGNEKEELCEFYKSLLKEDVNNIISLDETAIYINMIKDYGYSKKGRRAYYKTSTYPFKKYNLLCAIKNNKIIGAELYDSALDKEKFKLFLEKFVKNKYENHVLLMDNAKFHHNKEVKDYIRSINNRILYTIRYHAENNPIENFFNQLKHYIKLKSPENLEEIEETIVEIFENKIKRHHLENYFKHTFMRGKEFIKKCLINE